LGVLSLLSFVSVISLEVFKEKMIRLLQNEAEEVTVKKDEELQRLE
jgi:hypothetical protein